MAECLISFEPNFAIDFYGVNNIHLELIKKEYPLLKIITRGTKIKIVGQPKELSELKEKIDFILNIISKQNEISTAYFEKIIQSSIDEIKENFFSSFDKSDFILTGTNNQMIRAKTLNQKKMVKAIAQNDILFVIGPAGTGKTYTAVALAVRALKLKLIKKIILTRPAVEAGESLGFLPGDLKEKIDPYLRPLYDALEEMISLDKIHYYITNKIIEIAPLAYMRGRTLDNAYVILDEAQNSNEQQLKMFLTRLGPKAKAIITGDPSQIDLIKSKTTGLSSACKMLQNIEGIAILYFDDSDVVRHPLVKKIIQAYNKSIK